MTSRTESATRIAHSIGEIEPSLIALRRDLHSHPEASWNEHRTTEVLGEMLRVAGMEPELGPTGTGLICDIGTEGPVVAIRGDIDALALNDLKEVPYRSQFPGLCHGCGHDLHATVTVGAAMALASELKRSEIPGRVRILLQPAEEAIPGGARCFVDAGRVDDVEVVFALHSDPSRQVGSIGVSAGAITSAADQFTIRLHGPGGHTGRPHETADLAHIAAKIAIELPATLGRLCDPRDGLNVTFGAIQVGTAPNVIATQATLLGSLRASGRGAWENAPTHFRRVLRSIVEPLGATWELDHKVGAPPIMNDPWAVAHVESAARLAPGVDHVGPTAQSAGGEDFSWYGDKAKLGYFRLGVWDPAGLRVDLHAGNFDVHEAAIGIGATVLAGAAFRALEDLVTSS